VRDREREIAKNFGILNRIESIESDLLKVKSIEEVEFDLDGFYDNINYVIILVRYDIPTASDTYFTDRAILKMSVIETAKEHGLARTDDRIEDYGAHFYFVFRIADKEKFYKEIA